jgi:uncharacterized protein YdhG (YjbR/CyaY superfamily)
MKGSTCQNKKSTTTWRPSTSPNDAPSTNLARPSLPSSPKQSSAIAYGLPAFKLNGKAIAGFGAFKNHLSYFPHSGSVIEELNEDTSPYVASRGTLQFPVDTPLPGKLVEELITVRLRQIRVG